MKPIVGPYKLRDPYTGDVVADVWTVGVKWVSDGRQLGAYVMFTDKPDDIDIDLAVSLMRERHASEGFPA